MSGPAAGTDPDASARRGPRSAAAAAVAVMVLLLDLVGFSQLIFAGPLAESRVAGIAAMLAAYVAGSLAFVCLRRGTPVTLSFIGASAIVQASMAASVAELCRARGIADPEAVGGMVLLACGLATAVAGLVFATLGMLRASLLAQLLPYPVLTGFLGGVGLLFVRGGVGVGLWTGDPVGRLLEPDTHTLALLAATLGVAAGTFWLPRRLRHWTVYPGTVLAAFLGINAALAALGVGTEQAQAAGWLLDVPATGPLLPLPPAAALGHLDAAFLLLILPKVATAAVVGTVVQILYVVSVEIELRQDLGVDRVFVGSGAANLAAAAFGAPTLGFGRTSTLLLHSLGGGNRLGFGLTVAAMAALLVVGAGPLGLFPRPLAGGAVVAIGLGLLASLAAACRTLPAWETAIALAVCAVTALFGATLGFLLGIALAVVIFAGQYGRIPAVRRTMTGAERPSSVTRAPAPAALLAEGGGRTLIHTLQGYLFFLNAQGILARASAAPADLRCLILDFRECVGLDSSALLVFRKVAELAERRGFEVLLVHLDPAARALVERVRLGGRVRILDTLDQALQRAEAGHLAEAGLAEAGAGEGFARHVARALGCDLGAADFDPYVETRALAAGEVLLRQGEPAEAMHFVERGLVSIELEVPGRPNIPLRTTTPGTVIGEIALVQDGRRTATAVAVGPSRVASLDRAALRRMERERPDLAFHLQRYLIRELAGKLAATNRLIQAELR